MPRSPFIIHGKLVVVTGASSGIGAAVAEEFAARGARLALIGRDPVALDAVRRTITARGGTAWVFPFDLTRTDGIGALVASIAEAAASPVQVLVHAAGFGILGTVAATPATAYAESLAIHFFAPLALVHAVLPDMQRARSGQIIVVTSGVGARGLPGVSPYAVGKAALRALTESLRVELKPWTIDVLSISPGLVETNFAHRLTVHGSVAKTFTRGRATTPTRVARAVARASARRQSRVVLSMRTRMAAHLNHLAPGLLDAFLARTVRTPDDPHA